jgi:hypothetical protein
MPHALLTGGLGASGGIRAHDSATLEHMTQRHSLSNLLLVNDLTQRDSLSKAAAGSKSVAITATVLCFDYKECLFNVSTEYFPL